MNNKNLNYYITKYFSDYLPNIIGTSKRTICSYRDTFIILLEYLQREYKININNMELDMIDYIKVEKFLDYLENERNNSVSTRNQRLAAISSFYKYLQKRELAVFDLCSDILTIPKKKAEVKVMAYFSVDEIKLLINKPNTKKKYGFRDYVLLLFMYETASRAQEISDLQKKQLFLKDNYVVLIGKGNKNRRIPITKELSNLLVKYIDIFKIESDDSYVFQNACNQKITTKGIEYILIKYIKECKEKYTDKFKNNYTNHSMRHTRAMHLLESGVNLIYIRDILGHASIITTEIYAKTNPKIKEQQILQHSQNLKVKQRYSKKEKEDLLHFLKNSL
ncbi:MAG: tyrosine-type recombinase/integrase [Bacilli bacterium]